MQGIKGISTAILLAIGLLVSNLNAQPGCQREPGRGKEPPLGMFADELKLTDAQEKRLEEIRYKREMEAIDIRAQLEKEKLHLDKAMNEEKFDRKKIIAQAEKVVKLQGSLELLNISGKLDAMEVLTDEQRARLKEIRKEKRSEMKKMGEEKMDMPGGHKCIHKKMAPPDMTPEK